MTTLRHTVPIDAIISGDRHRKNMGDVKSLADSIERIGLVHAVAVTADYRLIAGGRRIAAFRLLARNEIDVQVCTHISDAGEMLDAERDENTCREEMKPGEKVALGRALEELERPKAKERRIEGNRIGGKGEQQVGVNFTPTSDPAPKVRDIIGKALGMSGISYQRAGVVVDASEDESLAPEVRAAAQSAREQMDKTGKITPAYDSIAEALGRTPSYKPKSAKPSTNGKGAHQVNAKTYKGRSVAKGFRASINTLIGIGSGIENVDLSDVQPTAEEVEAWLVELTVVVAAINRVRRQLRGTQ